jgi:phage protein D
VSTRASDLAVISARPRIWIGGEARPSLGEALLAAQLRLPLAGMASAELRLLNWGTDADSGRTDFQFGDLALGDRIEIRMGEQSEAPDFAGDITAIEERYGEGAPQIVLLAEDGLHRMARRRGSRVFEDQSIEDVARDLAGSANLECDLNLPGHTATWHQLNESDLAFLLRLTDPLDLFPRIQDGRLRIRDEEPDRTPEALDPAINLERARLIADLNQQPLSVTVRGYNLADDADIEADADSLSPAPQGTTAADLLGRLSWEGESVLSHPAPRTQAEADAMAERRLRRRARRFVHGELVCRGTPGLHSGREVELSGISSRFTGRYLVVDCAHRFDSAEGYHTRLSVSRADWND